MKLALVLAAFAVVVSGALAGDMPPSIAIREPLPGQPALGEVMIAVDVMSAAAIDRVEVLLDGHPALVFRRPPYRAPLEIGMVNRRHLIEAVVVDREGREGRAEVITAAVPQGGRFGVSLQQLYVTATRSARRVLDLNREDFKVNDDGQDQELITFARGDIPFTAVLLIDASTSMVGDRLDAAKAGALRFLEQAGPLDEVSVLAFSDRVLGRTKPTETSDEVAEVLSTVVAQGGTALHDYLFAALKLLERRQGRRVVVLLSDGIDSHSALEMRHVMLAARRSQAMLFWIWLADENSIEFAGGELRQIYSSWHNTAAYQSEFRELRKTVEESGGRIIPVSQIATIETVFVDILNELRDQYVLGYYPSNELNDGRWHRVKVDVRRADIDVRAHRGYVDF